MAFLDASLRIEYHRFVALSLDTFRLNSFNFAIYMNYCYFCFIPLASRSCSISDDVLDFEFVWFYIKFLLWSIYDFLHEHYYFKELRGQFHNPSIFFDNGAVEQLPDQSNNIVESSKSQYTIFYRLIGVRRIMNANFIKTKVRGNSINDFIRIT